jgi:tRNA (uracil-5-)-methyltransferase TRM9
LSTNKEVFGQIAESWYRVRHWPLLPEELKELTQRWKQGRLLNIGCAHGPDFLPFRQDFKLYGLDSAYQMLEQAIKYSHKFNFHASLATADARYLPFKDNSFDWVIAIASYHHIKGDKERNNAFSELKRVLKPGGEAFLTVWNRRQPRFWLKSQEQLVPWRKKDQILYRYYHLYSYRELRNILIKTDFEIISIKPELSYHFPIPFFSHNICTLIRKQA